MTFLTNGHLFRVFGDAANDPEHAKHSLAQELKTKFRSLEEEFYRDVHSQVDVGLAADQVNQTPDDCTTLNIMTIHGCRHVSDLIESLDKIAMYIAETVPAYALNVEEAYILLCAAHLHDTGNLGGRKDHAERASELIEDHMKLFSGTERRQQIFEVSRVHGGRDEDYGKDLLGSLTTDNYQRPRLPLLAAMLRLGDELSENPERVPNAVANWYKVSGESNLAYRYAESFRGFRLAQDQLFVTLRVYPAQHNYAGTMNGMEMSFCEYLEGRLNKMEREVRYCSQYARPYLSIRRIRVSILIHEKDGMSRSSTPKTLTLELERGYPNDLPPLIERCHELESFGTLEDYFRSVAK